MYLSSIGEVDHKTIFPKLSPEIKKGRLGKSIIVLIKICSTGSMIPFSWTFQVQSERQVSSS